MTEYIYIYIYTIACKESEHTNSARLPKSIAHCWGSNYREETRCLITYHAIRPPPTVDITSFIVHLNMIVI